MCDLRAQVDELRRELNRAEAECRHLRDRLEACRDEYARQVSRVAELDGEAGRMVPHSRLFWRNIDMPLAEQQQ